MFRRSARGFTLLELLVVIAILVVLAGTAVPWYIKSKEKANIDIVKQSILANGLLSNALDLFHTNMGRYPTTEEGLAALMTKPEVKEGEKDNWVQCLKTGVDLTDPWGSPYQYKCPGDHNTDSYDLSSNGPDKNAGTDDDVVNWSTDASK
jgi:general secretion pathway protein G